MDKISKAEMDRFERALADMNKKKVEELKRTQNKELPIDRPTKEQISDYRSKKAAYMKKLRERDLDKDRKNFSSYLRINHGMEMEDLARMYDDQKCKCKDCGRAIKLSKDYSIIPGRIICKRCEYDRMSHNVIQNG